MNTNQDAEVTMRRAVAWGASFVAVTVLGIWVTYNYEWIEGHALQICCGVPRPLSESDLAREAAFDRDQAKSDVAKAARDLDATKVEIDDAREASVAAASTQKNAANALFATQALEEEAKRKLSKLRECEKMPSVTSEEVTDAESERSRLRSLLSRAERDVYCARLALSKQTGGVSTSRFDRMRCRDSDLRASVIEPGLAKRRPDPRERIDVAERRKSKLSNLLRGAEDKVQKLKARYSCTLFRGETSEDVLSLELQMAKNARLAQEVEAAEANRVKSKADEALAELEDLKAETEKALSSACKSLEVALGRLVALRRQPFAAQEGRQLAELCRISVKLQ